MARISRMILMAALVLLTTTSAAPVPAGPILLPAVIRIPDPGPVVVVVRSAQACDFTNATTRLREVVFDGRGYPFGEVAAWSCGSASAALDEFNARLSAMQAEALEKYP